MLLWWNRVRAVLSRAIAHQSADADALVRSSLAAILQLRGGPRLNLELTRMLAGAAYARREDGQTRGVPVAQWIARDSVVAWRPPPTDADAEAWRREPHERKMCEIEFSDNYERDLAALRARHQREAAESDARWRRRKTPLPAALSTLTRADAVSASPTDSSRSAPASTKCSRGGCDCRVWCKSARSARGEYAVSFLDTCNSSTGSAKARLRDGAAAAAAAGALMTKGKTCERVYGFLIAPQGRYAKELSIRLSFFCRRAPLFVCVHQVMVKMHGSRETSARSTSMTVSTRESTS